MKSGLLFTQHWGEVWSLHSSKAIPNYELPCTITHTMRGPWPHKSCPTPTIVRCSTMASPELRVPPRNSSAQRRTPALIPSERGQWQRWQEKNCNPWEKMTGANKSWSTQVWVRRQLRQGDVSNVCLVDRGASSYTVYRFRFSEDRTYWVLLENATLGEC